MQFAHDDTRTAKSGGSTVLPDDAPAAGGALKSGQVRALQIAVVTVNILILIGLIAVFARMFYLSSQPSGKVPAWVPEARLALPAGAAVHGVSLSGDRLLVHYGTADGGRNVAILDLPSGKVLTRVDLGDAERK
ncbi:MAG: hypothetical protein ACREC6_01165 [Hyphomicrobiaceae bacterium]